jgi:uncharacterized phage protein (TIGR02216 family)
MTPFPWREAMQFGFGVLRLSPRAFWAMTPRELGAAMEARAGRRGNPLPRDALAQLMGAFPDTEVGYGR